MYENNKRTMVSICKYQYKQNNNSWTFSTRNRNSKNKSENIKNECISNSSASENSQNFHGNSETIHN